MMVLVCQKGRTVVVTRASFARRAEGAVTLMADSRRAGALPADRIAAWLDGGECTCGCSAVDVCPDGAPCLLAALKSEGPLERWQCHVEDLANRLSLERVDLFPTY